MFLIILSFIILNSKKKIKYYIAIINRFIITLAIFILFAFIISIIFISLNLFLKSYFYFYLKSFISYIFFKDIRIIKLLDLILSIKNNNIFNNWLV
jgi:hypothetical protein